SFVSIVARSRDSGLCASSTRRSARFSANWRYPSAWANRTTSPSERYRRSSVGSSIASTGSCPASTPIEPTAVRVESSSTSSEKTSPSVVGTSSKKLAWAISPHRRRLEDQADQGHRERSVPDRETLAALACPEPASTRATEDADVRRSSSRLDDFLDRALEEERALRDLVVLAFDDLLEAADRFRDRHVGAGGARELFGDEERLGEEALDLARALHRQLVLVGELVDAEDRDDVLELLVALQDLLDAVGDAEVVLAEDVRLEDRRGRVERVDGRVDAFFGDRARQRRGRVQMREHRRRRRVGVVVGRHVDGLDRGDRAALGRCDPLLQSAHLGLQRRLVADLRGHAAQQGRDLGARLDEAEDVVDEQQHVLALVAEVFGHRQAGQRDAHARSGRL